MDAARFLALTPVVPVYNMRKAIQYYTERLGFRLRFQDDPQNPAYVVVERDAARFHIQSHDPTNPDDEVDPIQIRFLIDDVDRLFDEYQDKAVFQGRTALIDTPWGTREFAFFDLDGNGLFFYRNL